MHIQYFHIYILYSDERWMVNFDATYYTICVVS